MSGGSQNVRFTIQAIDAFSSTMNNLDNQIQGASSQFQALGRAGQAIGKALAGLGAAGAVGMTFAVKAAADFERQMSSVNAMLVPTQKEFEQLTALAREMGATTAFTSVEAAQAIEEMGKAGISTADILNGGLKGALDLATAGELDLATAAQIGSTALNAFSADGLSFVEAADLLAGSANASATSVSEMQYALSMSSAVAAGLGVTFEDTTTALALFANSGLRGSDAGTSLKTMLSRLSPMTEKAYGQMKELGIITEDGSNKFFDAKGNVQSMASIAETLKTSLAGLTAEQRQNALYTLFGSDAIRGATILYKGGAEGINEMNAAMSKTTAADVAAEKLNNLHGKLTILKSSIDSIAITFGTALLPALTKITEYITMLADKFNALPVGMQQVIAIGIVLGSIFALLVGGLLLLMPGIMATVSAMGAVSAAFTAAIPAILPIIGVIAAVVAAVALIGVALVTAYNKVGWFRDMVNTAWESIKSAFSTALTFISGIVNTVMTEISTFFGSQLEKITAFWSEHGATIEAGIKTVMEAISTSIQGTMAFIQGIMEVAWPIISGAVEIAWGLIKTAVETGLDLILGIIETTMALIEGDWEGAWESIKGIAEDIMGNIIGFFEDIDLVGIGEDIIGGLIKGIGSMAGAVERKVEALASLIPKGLKDFLGIHSPSRLIRDEVGKFIPLGMAVGIDGNLNALKKSVKSMAAAAVPNMNAVSAMPMSMPSMSPSNGYSTSPVRVPQQKSSSSNADLISALNANASRPVQVTVDLDGRTIAEVTHPYTDNLLAKSFAYQSRTKYHR